MIMTRKILLLGKNGQLGQMLTQYLASKNQRILALGRCDEGGDLTNLQALKRRVEEYKPDIIINAAAYTAVDKAEANETLVYAVNAKAAGALAELAKKQQCWLIHYSTDYVFDGAGDLPWQETDPTNPINLYGKTKCAGEKAIQASCDQFMIFRSSWIYSTSGHNFLKTILQLAQEKEILSVVNDQIGTPTGVQLITDVTWQVISQMIPEQAGIYHLAAKGYTSWYDFAQLIINEAKQQQPLAMSKLMPMTTADYMTPAKRPLNSRLATQKLIDTFNVQLPHWQVEAKQTLVSLLKGHIV